MDSPDSNQFDIFQIYRRYCDIKCVEGCRSDEEPQEGIFSRESLNQLLKLVESRLNPRMSIFDEIYKLMSRPELLVDFSDFSRVYDFVFFICRENGQKNISVNRAVTCWKLVLAGRFRLLKQWCDFVEKNQRHNISEDTWRQVLAFCRCVHENLEGYDPEGAWPVLIDDFVEHMYRTMGSSDDPNLFCSCGDLEAQPFEDPLPGLKIFPGFKRKMDDDVEMHELEPSDKFFCPTLLLSSKRRYIISNRQLNWEENPLGNTSADYKDITKHNDLSGCAESPCAVEGCLSRGFAGLFTGHSCLQFDRKRSLSYI